jgi:hypothetical protein
MTSVPRSLFPIPYFQIMNILPNIKAGIQATIDYLMNFKWEKIIRWFGFNLAIAGAPFLGKYLINCKFTSSSCQEPNLLLFGQGDLILISCAILAEAAGELLQTDSNIAIRRLSVLLISFVFVATFLNAFVYGNMEKLQRKEDVIAWSINMLVVSATIGLISKFLGKD